jgi:hypothetical protein
MSPGRVAKTGQVEVAIRIHAGHLGGFATDQGSPCLAAPRGDALDDQGCLVDGELAGGEVVEEQQRLRPLADQIVDAHGNQIDAHGIDLPGIDGDAQLGADPIGRGDDDRVGIARGLEVEQPAKAAQPSHHSGPVGRFGGRLDAFDQGVAGIDIDTSILVSQRIGTVSHGGPPAG